MIAEPDLAALITTLIPGAPLTITGSSSLEFASGAVDQYINMVATFSVPDQTVDAPFDVHYGGTYSIEGDAVIFQLTTIEGGWGTAVAHTKAGDFEIPLPNPGDIPPIAGGPTTCSGDQLTLAYTSGVADATAVYRRV